MVPKGCSERHFRLSILFASRCRVYCTIVLTMHVLGGLSLLALSLFVFCVFFEFAGFISVSLLKSISLYLVEVHLCLQCWHASLL